VYYVLVRECVAWRKEAAFQKNCLAISSWGNSSVRGREIVWGIGWLFSTGQEKGQLKGRKVGNQRKIKYHVAPKKTRIVVSLAFVDGTNAEVVCVTRQLAFCFVMEWKNVLVFRDPIRYQRILAFYREGLKQWNATQQENAYVKFYSWCDAARFIIALTKNQCFRFPFYSKILIEKDVLIQFSLKRKTGPLGTQ